MSRATSQTRTSSASQTCHPRHLLPLFSSNTGPSCSSSSTRYSTYPISTSRWLTSTFTFSDTMSSFCLRSSFFKKIIVVLPRLSSLLSSAFLFVISATDGLRPSSSLTATQSRSCAGTSARTLVRHLLTVIVDSFCRCCLLVFSSFWKLTTSFSSLFLRCPTAPSCASLRPPPSQCSSIPCFSPPPTATLGVCACVAVPPNIDTHRGTPRTAS